MSEEARPAVEPPDDSADAHAAPAPDTAGGLATLASTFQHLQAGPGLVRGARVLSALNQPGGIDCPGCAWPEPHERRGRFEFCENGVKAIAWEADRRRADADFFARHSLAALAAQSDHWLGQQGRITQPMLKDEGADRYRPITWDEAFALVAAELTALAHPDQAIFYTSGRTSNEAAFLFQLFVRTFGTNNLPDCSNLCHESSGVALRQTLGVGKGTVQLEDFALCDTIFVIGQNPGTNHPRMMTVLQEAAERGCRIVSINPLPEAALMNFRHPQRPADLAGLRTPISTLFLQVRVGGDGALLKGIMKLLLAAEARRPGQVLDHAFIATHTVGFPALAAALDRLDLADLEAESGVARADMQAAADLVAGARRLICCWAMGLTQHENAVATICDVVNLLLLGGHVGRPGAGACPVRGHSNVQGDRTMGITTRLPEAFADGLRARFGVQTPKAPGLDTVSAIAAMDEGRAHVLFALGGNFLQASPDTHRTARALSRCRLTVHVSTKLNRAHLVTGRRALILPCLGRTEVDEQTSGPQFVTVEDSMGLVHTSQGRLAPASPALRSEVAIVAGLAEAVLGPDRPLPWREIVDDYDRIRTHIAAVVPGLADMNERVRAPNGFALPNAARERRFETASGKAEFTTPPLVRRRLAPGQLLLTTLRSHDQFNTTIYGLADRYRGVQGGRRVLFMNERDLQQRGLEDGARVDIDSHFEGERRTVTGFRVVRYAIAPGCAAAYFPEANPLVPLAAIDPHSRTPASKSIVITVRPSP